MKMRNVTTLIALFLSLGMYAQQTPLNTLYAYNMYTVNPAVVGSEKATQFNLSHRMQWLGFEGAPVTTWITGQHQLNNKMGIGASLSMDKMAFLERLNANVSYAYRLKLNRDNNLAFGISLGMVQGKLDLNSVTADDYTDDVLLNPQLNGTAFDAQFGIHYTFKKDLKIGLSFPQMLQSDVSLDMQNIEGAYNLTRHTMFYASYDMAIDDKVSFIPTLLIRDAQNQNRQLDFIGNFTFEKKYWGGLGVRQQGGFLINLGMEVAEKFGITYAYEFSNYGASSNTSGSHEIMLRFKLDKKEEGEVDSMPEEDAPEERKAPAQRF